MYITRHPFGQGWSLDGLSPSDRALTEDLLARIAAAISPYFE